MLVKYNVIEMTTFLRNFLFHVCPLLPLFLYNITGYLNTVFSYGSKLLVNVSQQMACRCQLLQRIERNLQRLSKILILLGRFPPSSMPLHKQNNVIKIMYDNVVM